MDTFYLVILGFLALLAVIDLFVGVSNDASNFLSAAVGSRIASFKVICAVAGVGILLGTTFSGGMMEIAKTGVFNPGMFSFSDVMVIYLSVMVTDVMLLNLFNAMGLPTSTTVSIVFELLGAAVGVALNRLFSFGGSIAELGAYINNEKAIAMIAAILASVVIAFVSGVIVQYLMRLLFSFRYEKMFRRLGGIYGGFALTMIFYFLVVKGARGASFMTPELLQLLDDNTALLLAGIFVVTTVLLQAGMILKGLNVFRIIILAGTFALAFAFAGNDLVNFVGVPIAAMDSCNIFSAVAGTASDKTYAMSALAEPISPPTILLILSGVVMVLTIRFSKSARQVIETSLNLSSSANGTREQFGATTSGRLIVRSTMTLGRIVNAFVPIPLKKKIDKRFEPAPVPVGQEPLPFDHIRASINLILTAILISMATSLQLPLSTTYVTFMVGMGSSFADRAWDRESAVYRVSGVLVVIVGWFLTAITAFISAGLVASLILWGGKIVSLVLIVIVVAVIVKMNFFSSAKKKEASVSVAKMDQNAVRRMLAEAVEKNYHTSVGIYRDVLRAFLADSERGLRRASNRSSEFLDRVSESRALYYQMARRTASHDDKDVKFFYYRSLTNMKEVCRVLVRTASQALEHVANRHRIFTGVLAGNLIRLSDQLIETEEAVRDFCAGWGDSAEVREKSRRVIELVEHYQGELLSNVGEYNLSLRGCELYMVFLQYARELVNHYDMVVLLQSRLNEICAEASGQDPAQAPAAPVSAQASEPPEKA